MIRILAVLMIIAGLTGCAPTTRTTGASFTDPAFVGQRFSSLVVEADRSGLAERQSIETGTVQALRQSGVNASASLEVLPPTRNYSDAAVKQILRNSSAQGVIEIIPTGKQVRERYYPPVYSGSAYYGGFGYGRHGPGFGGGMGFGPGYYEPGYTVREPRVTYDVTLYAFPGYRKVWTAQFQTDGSGGMDYGDVGAHFGAALVERLQKDGVIDGR